MKNVFKTHALLLGLAMSCFGFTAAQAAVKTYVGPGNGVWTDGANWSPAGVPTLSDDVTVASSTSFVYVDIPVNATIDFSTLTVGVGGAVELKGTFNDAGSLVIDGGDFIQENNFQHLLGGNLILKANGKLRSVGLATVTLPTSSVNFIAENIDIQVDGEIDVSGAGHYQGSNANPGPGVGGSSATGPGGGANCGNGGAGSVAAGGVAYSSVSYPFNISRGSAGGATGASGSSFSEGGGLVQLVAKNLFTINGKIRANGLSSGSDKGGGAGGSISLVAGEYAGTPQEISAHGGSGFGNGGGGGGGCVRGAYVNSAGTINFNLAGGLVDVAGGTGFNPGSTGQTVTAFVIPAPLKFEIFPGSKTTTTLDLIWMWGGGSIEDHYILDKSVDGVVYTNVTSIPTSTFGFGYELTGLTPVNKYFLRVASVSSTYAITSSDFAYLRAFTYPLSAAAPSISGLGPTSALASIGLNGNSGSSNYLRVLFGVTTTSGTFYYGANGTVVGSNPTYFLYPAWSGAVYGLVPSTTYSFFNVLSTYNDETGDYLSSATGTLVTTTPLVPPTPPTLIGETSTTLNISWSQNGNPATTPYAVYNSTLNQYHLADGTLTATPTFYPLSSWNGKAKGLTPATLYNFKIVMRNENGTQNATSTAVGNYTLTASGGAFSLGGGPTNTTTPTGSNTSTTGTAWYFGTPTTPPSTGTNTSTTLPLTTTPPTLGTSAYYLPDGTLITPQLIFQMMNNAYGTTPSNIPSVSLYKGKNLSSNILFSRFSTQANPLKVGSTLSFRYTYQNPNKTGSYRIERILLNPLGKVVARSVVSSRIITLGQTITYNPSQYFTSTLTTGLYTMRVRITSPDTKTIYDENTFDVSVKK